MNSILPSEQIDLSQEPPFRLGTIEVRPAMREVIANGVCDVLEPRVMQVLVALARRRDTVISRDELILSCWEGRVVSDDAINRCISRVRRVLETHGGFSLETVPRVGYRLIETASAPSPVQDVGGIGTGSKPWLHRRARFVIASLVLFVLAVGGAYWLLNRAGQETALAPGKFSIAVLPFTPYGEGREPEQLGESVAASIADNLSNEGFEVVSPDRTRSFRGAAKANAAQVLKTDFLIDGEMRRDGGTIKVALRVIDGRSGTTLLADSFEAAANEAGALPDIIANLVSNYGWGVAPGVNPSVRWNPRVLAGSLKVINLLVNRKDPAVAYDVARQLAASAPEDSYAQMLHGLAAAGFIFEVPADHRVDIVLEGRAAAEKALKLDPEYGDAYAVLEQTTPPFEWAKREAYLRKGLRLRASSPIAYVELIDLLMSSGYLRYGARLAEGTYASHPYYATTLTKVINGRLWLGDPAGAIPLIRQGRKLRPLDPWYASKMFEATALYGAIDDAEALLNDPAASALLQPQGERKTYNTIITALRSRRPADVQAVVDDCRAAQARRAEFKRTCFMAVVHLGRLDDAFRMAENLYPEQGGTTEEVVGRRALAMTPFGTAYLFAAPLAPLRADPRFQQIAERTGLLQYWRSTKRAPDFCTTEKAPVCRLLPAP